MESLQGTSVLLLSIVSQLQVYPSVLCSVTLVVGLCKLHFPDPFAAFHLGAAGKFY